MSLVAKVGATELTGSFDRQFRDELKGAGSFSLSFQNDDPDIPALGDVVTFEIDGVARFSGPVTSDNIITHAPGEEADQTTGASGLGRLGVTRKGLVRPSRGVDAVPIERSRSQFWGAWDYDDSAWPLGKNIRRADTPTSYISYKSLPEWWPAKEAWWVWSDQVDVDEDEAPVGRCLVRHSFTVADDGEIEIQVGFNNKGFLFFDGARVGDIANAPKDGNRFRLEVTAGVHVLAASVTNFIRDGGYIDAIWTVDGDGFLDTLIEVSDETNTLVLGYPANLPTITPGWAIRTLLEEMQAEGELVGVTLDFDDDLDSDGNAWLGVTEIVTPIGTTLFDYLLALSDWAIDVAMDPGSNLLQAWNWGERGTTTAVTVDATTDRNTSEVEALSHSGKDIRANRLLVAYKRGLFEVEDLDGNDPVPAFVDLGDLETEEGALEAATALLELRKQPAYATTLTLAPVSAEPYVDFQLGDYITHPDETGSTKESRVLGITVTAQDDEAVLTYAIELNEVRQEIENLHDNTLKRYALGSLSGGAQVVSKSGESLPALSRISEKQVAEFSFDGELEASSSPVRPSSSSGNLLEVFAELTEAGSTDTDLDIRRNGSSLTLLTIPAGDTEAEVSLDADKTARNVDKYRVVIDVAGTGAEGLDVQIRAI